LRAFRRGLKETGDVEGEDVAIDYPWAENQPNRLPALVAGFVRRQVTVIAAVGVTVRYPEQTRYCVARAL
jgi:putative ABC transport system substrate-binding protein